MKAREDGKAYAQDVSLEELRDFVLKNNLNNAGCRFCGSETWDIPSHNGMPIVLNLPTPYQHDGGINSFYMSCARCGGMETFSAQTVVSRLMGWI